MTARILLEEKSSEAWSLPAGMIEPGESPNEAIVREVKEETGLIITPNRILGVFGGEQFRYVYPNGDQVEYTVILMNCSIVADTGEITDSETMSLQYFDKKSMPELALLYPKDVLFNEITASYIQQLQSTANERMQSNAGSRVADARRYGEQELKYLPPELREWYFPFNWKAEALWQLEGELEIREVATLEWHLDKPFWSSERGKGMLFDLNPREVITNPQNYPYHCKRIYEADISYPICMTTYQDREIVIDGIHRLTKIVERKIRTIKVKILNEDVVQQIAEYA